MSKSKSVLSLIGRSATADPHVAAFLRVQYKHVLHVYTQTVSHSLTDTCFLLENRARFSKQLQQKVSHSYMNGFF